MLRLLIVEDEERIRKGIAQKILRLTQDVEIAGEASNGEEGLIRLEELKPDIVITDIKMPVIDGIHFIEMALESSPQTKFIIISGYEDFKFAQQAVRLGVSDYLLKPVNNDDLKSAIENLRLRIEDERRRLDFVDSLKERASENILWKKNKSFLSLTDGEYTDAVRFIRAMAECGYTLDKDKFTALQVRIMGWQEDTFPNGDKGLVKFAVANILEEVLGEEGTAIASDGFDPELHIAVLLNHSQDVRRLEPYMQKAVDHIRELLKAELFMGVGSTHEDVLSFSASYKDAALCADQKVVYKDRDILFREDYEKVRGNNFILDMEDRRKLSYLFRTENMDEAVLFIKGIFTKLEKQKINCRSVRALCMDIFITIMNEIKEKNIFLFKDLFEVNIDEYFTKCVSLKDYQNKITEIIDRLSLFLIQDNMAGGRKIVSEIKSMIDTEYYKDLKLNQIASQFYINPSYLSTLFLQETGKNFSQYLTDIRIGKAKEFLTTTKLSSGRIAEYIGYNDRSYFVSVFQKAVGLSPSAYREENKQIN